MAFARLRYRWKRWVLGALLLLLMGEIILFDPEALDVSFKERQKADDGSGDFPLSGQQQRMIGVHFVEAREDRREWELWADSARGAGDWELNAVKIVFYLRPETPNGMGEEVRVTGRSGWIRMNDQGARSMEVQGSVITEASNGYRMATEKVEYLPKERFLVSPTPVSVTSRGVLASDGLALTGNTMRLSLESNQIWLVGSVKAKKRVGAKSFLRVQSETSELSSQDRNIVFRRNVVLNMGGVTVSGPTAILHFDSRQKQITRVTMRDGVRIRDADKSATARNMALDLKTERFVLTGSPRVTRAGDELVGERIDLLDGGRRVQVHNARARMERQTLEAVN